MSQIAIRNCWKHCILDSVELKGLQLRDCIAPPNSVPLALAGSQRLLYRLFCRIQASSLQWLRLTGVLAVPGIQSAPLARFPGPLNSLLSDTYGTELKGQNYTGLPPDLELS